MQLDNRSITSSEEKEDLYGRDQEGQEISAPITRPFDPRKVNIITQTYVVATIVDRLKSGMIILDPDYQRFPNLWSDVQQSRLIESMIIRIPIPTFYFDADNDDVITVVDGLQRLYTIRRFMALDKDDNERLRLKNLEYLPEYNGKLFEELPVNIQTRIRETNLTAYVIRPGTPDNVRNSIFTRINTGGVQLTPAEIRNSVYRGKAANLLRKLAHSSEFVEATNQKINPERMLDCEYVNRFLAFYILNLEKEYEGNLEDYLNLVLEKIQDTDEKELQRCEEAFISSMSLCHKIFGQKAFRKKQVNGRYGRINKPLFECVSVTLAKLDKNEQQNLLNNKDSFLRKYFELLDKATFVESITTGTAKIESIRTRYRNIVVVKYFCNICG